MDPNDLTTEDAKKLSVDNFMRIMKHTYEHSKADPFRAFQVDTMDHVDSNFLAMQKKDINFDESTIEKININILINKIMTFCLEKAQTTNHCEFYVPFTIPGGFKIKNWDSFIKKLIKELENRGLYIRVIEKTNKIYIEWVNSKIFFVVKQIN